jgi:hypothetical protein
MPKKETIAKARRDKRAGKSPTTQAGEFIREEIDEIRRGKHGARSPQQAIAIGLSEARRAGVDLPPPRRGKTSARTRKSAEYAYEAGQGKRKPRRRPRVSRAVSAALKREPTSTASRKALSRQAARAASRRSASQRVPKPPSRQRARKDLLVAKLLRKKRRGHGRAARDNLDNQSVILGRRTGSASRWRDRKTNPAYR